MLDIILSTWNVFVTGHCEVKEALTSPSSHCRTQRDSDICLLSVLLLPSAHQFLSSLVCLAFVTFFAFVAGRRVLGFTQERI